MSILTLTDFPAVRAVIDVKLTEDDLPDEVMLSPAYIGAAEAWVLSRDPQAETRTGDEAAHITRAAVFYMASLLVPAVARLTSVSIQTVDMSYSKPPIDISKRVKELKALAEDEINMLLKPSEITPEKPKMFKLGKSRRR